MKPYEIIKEKRIEKGYSQEYMASKLGKSQPAYRKIEEGKTRLNIELAKSIAKILSIHVDAIYHAEDDKYFIEKMEQSQLGDNNNQYNMPRELVELLKLQFDKLNDINQRLLIQNEQMHQAILEIAKKK